MFGSMPIAARSERNSAPCATTSTAGGCWIARLAAATARRRNAANVSAPSGVNAPLTQSANQPLMPWPSCTPKETSRRSGSSATCNPNASPTNSAVTRARESGDATIVAMPRLRSLSAAARACATPTAFNGISTLPCEMPWAFQSVSPCRRNQNAIGESVAASWNAPCTSVQAFLLHHALHRRPRQHAVEVRIAVRRQLHVHALAAPEFDIEQRRVGNRE